MGIQGQLKLGAYIRWILFFHAIFFYRAFAAAQEMPALPNTSDVITCFPDTAGYLRITVGPVDRDFDNLQDALDAAPLGSVLVLDAGTTFYGGFTLPAKGAGDEWIIITSSQMELLPEDESRIEPSGQTGDKLFPTQSSAMPKIVTNNLSGIPCFRTQANAHHFRLCGLEITADVSVIQSFGLINLGETSSQQNNLELVPHHLVVDRCFIHGHTEATVMKYGIRLDCAHAAIIESYISDFHSIGFDAQAISCINGPGPFRILNNYLEASGENILIGGGAPSIPGLVPSDIEVRNNHMFKPWSWRVGHPEYAGKHWTIKNLFELKTGKRVWLDGNIMENCWADLPIGQSGYAILLTVRTEGGAAPQADVSDVLITNNIIRHVGAGISLSGADQTQSNRSSRIMISNNLFDDINGPSFGDQNIFGPNDGTFLKIGVPRDVIVTHNSIFQSGPVTWAYGVTDSFVYTHNLSHSFISTGGYQGIYGPGQSQGNNTIQEYFPDITDANQHFHQNVLIGGNEARYSNFNSTSENYFPPDALAVGFEDYAGASLDYHGYALSLSSPYYKAGDDGEDIGVNLTELDSAFALTRGCDEVTTSTPLGKDPALNFRFNPNPATNILIVEMEDAVDVSYEIRDLTGRLVQRKRGEGSKTTIDIHTLSPGVYVLDAHTSVSIFSRLFVVQ